MTSAQWIWFGSSLSGLVLAFLGVYRVVITIDPEKHPKTVATILSLIFIAIVTVVAQFTIGVWYIDLIFLTLGILLLIGLLWILTKHEEQAIVIGDNIVKSLHHIDGQITYILSEISKGNTNVSDVILKALRYSLSEIERALLINHEHELRVALFRIFNPGGFSVIGAHRLTPKREKLIEQRFSYDNDNPQSIAAVAAQRKQTICIPALSDEKNENAQHWLKVEDDDKKEGCMLCVPIMRGLGDRVVKEPIGVLSVESPQENAFDCKLAVQITRYYLDKLEILLYCLELSAQDQS